jgi:hypothetical protein
VPDDGLCELKHVAQYKATLKCCVGRYISLVCTIKKHTHTHNGMYHSKTDLIMIFKSFIKDQKKSSKWRIKNL